MRGHGKLRRNDGPTERGAGLRHLARAPSFRPSFRPSVLPSPLGSGFAPALPRRSLYVHDGPRLDRDAVRRTARHRAGPRGVRDHAAQRPLGGLGALALTVGVARRLAPGLAADAAIGGLKYLPAADNGIFAGGTGGVTALGALGVSYALPLGGSTLRGLALRARYDIQRFLTPALRNEGFTSGEIVHRVALTLGWSVGQHGVGARP